MRIHKGDKVRSFGQGPGQAGQGDAGHPVRGQGDRRRACNVAKRHAKPTRATMQGGVIDKDMPMPVSAVAIVCRRAGPTRIGIRIDETGRKVRVCRKCGGEL